MPDLSCMVRECVYNDDEYCKKDSIQVGGSQAKSSVETCCESFRGRSSQGSVNAYEDSGSASPKTGIACEACDCTYNEKSKCCAGQVDITGSNAHDCQDTNCGSFECESCH